MIFEFKGKRFGGADEGLRPFVIAEIGVNHGCDIDLAIQLIDQAALGGASAVKFQWYTADLIASKKHSPAYWDTSKEITKTQHALFSKYDKFGRDEYEKLLNYCNTIGIEFMCTPFDLVSTRSLGGLLDIFKISSSDLTNFQLLREVGKFKKPVILSVGAGCENEIQSAITQLSRFISPRNIVLLHCVLNYPTHQSNANLRRIINLKKAFCSHPIGYSDHTIPDDHMTNLLLSWHFGAAVIEKHFTYDKSLPGNDHYHSMNQSDLVTFGKAIERDIEAIGSCTNLEWLDCEEKARQNARRGLYAKTNLARGSILRETDLIAKRPVIGVPADHIDNIVGRKILVDLKCDEPLIMDNLD